MSSIEVGKSVEQATVRCVIMRAGTSKGLFFHARDLPSTAAARDALLLELMGSPDVLQIDGLGGSRPITSKVAIIAPSTRADADVDYTFGQVELERASVTYDANCGNICAGVGPFALDEGLVEVQPGSTRVRIYNTNTSKIIIAEVPTVGGKAQVGGRFRVPGVPGEGAEIRMNWVGTIGSSTGRLLPTGSVTDRIVLEDGRAIVATLCDVANPCVWVRADDLGLQTSVLSADLNRNVPLLSLLREVRGKAAVLLGFCDEWQRAAELSPTVPFVGLVAPPADYLSLSGAAVLASDMDVLVRLIFMDRLHESIAGTGSICLAAASRIPGSVIHSVARESPEVLLIGHPSGITAARVRASAIASFPFVHFEELGFSRTARRLMAGDAYFRR
ncbi:2-methylaconitate cis-trans isomerase PrpF family protein [Peristeroidobacter soli]|jgi:2-methylaconitate cis-trans-isomerase PrpF|uniref:2-methylaconitate cis-trans isomerase PrpF family protein n=1 Tax=Peristeroidobacter soli TaxID=2497877 RepID=UPI00101C008D|nr:PrpF domain-containing protein [Peristeroidobacter soli]